MDLQGIHTVFFDAGNTLLKADPGIPEIYAEVARSHGMDRREDWIRKRFWRAWREKSGLPRHCREDRPLDSAEVAAWWKAFVLQVFEVEEESPSFDAFFDELYDRFARPESWTVFPDVLPCLDALEGRGVALGIISNWDDRLPAILEGHGLLSRFDPVIISAVVGWEKPQPKIFEIALARASLSPEQAVHVGDSPNDDCRGAARAGLRGVLIDRGGHFPDFEGERIRSLKELG